MRGGLPEGRPLAHGIGNARRTGAQGNHRLPGARRDREALLLRLLCGTQEGPAGRAKPQDRHGGADLAAPRHGVQAFRDPQAAYKLEFRRRAAIARFLHANRSKSVLEKAPDAFRTISEVADDLDVPQHVLRFWESRFAQIRPMKRGGGRRYYRPDDIDLLRGIRHLLYGQGYTIRGVQRILREQGPRFVQAVWQEGAPQPPVGRGGEEAEARTGERGLFGLWPAMGAQEEIEEEIESGGDDHDDAAAEGAGPAPHVRL